ncbi:MAG: phospho-N-acetylmuramoyl-pentapeptide-transferase, partial [bacterium]
MLYELLHPHFNIFTYLTFRTAGAVVTAALIMFVFGKPMIGWLRVKQGKGQPIRTDGPESHFKKAGTPTMGGAMILLSIFVGALLWADLKNPYVWIVLGVTAGYGFIGFLDDYAKVAKQKT